jgi:tRNA (guanine9-N1)-methyltransferase
LLVSGVKDGSKMVQNLEKANCKNWAVDFTAETYMTELQDKFENKNIVYLTADSPNVIENLDDSKAYIIGGIVDRNRYLNLTLNKAT